MNNKFPNLSVLARYHAIQFYDTSHPAHKPSLTYIRERGYKEEGIHFYTSYFLLPNLITYNNINVNGPYGVRPCASYCRLIFRMRRIEPP